MIENEAKRKVSYKKINIGLLKKAEELEMTLIIYSAYSDEPTVFRNFAAAINSFQKIKALEILER